MLRAIVVPVAQRTWALRQLLTKLQRIIALFLILESFKAEGVKKNPFGGLIFEIYDKTVEHYERKFICEMLLDNKRDKVSAASLSTPSSSSTSSTSSTSFSGTSTRLATRWRPCARA